MPKNDTLDCPNCGYDLSNVTSITTSSEKRWKYTGTILALVLVVSLPAIVLLAGLGVVTVGAVSQGWWVLYSTVVLMSATWTFGKETLEAVHEARK